MYQKTSVNKVSFKLKNKGTFFSDILWSEQYWPSYSVFVETGVQTLCLEQSYSIQLFIPASVCVYLPKPSGDLLWCFHWDSWSTHFAWNSYTAIYSSLCTLVHGQTCRWLTLDKSAGGLRVKSETKIWDKNLGQNLGQKFGTDGQTDKQTDKQTNRQTRPDIELLCN